MVPWIIILCILYTCKCKPTDQHAADSAMPTDALFTLQDCSVQQGDKQTIPLTLLGTPAVLKDYLVKAITVARPGEAYRDEFGLTSYLDTPLLETAQHFVCTPSQHSAVGPYTLVVTIGKSQTTQFDQQQQCTINVTPSLNQPTNPPHSDRPETIQKNEIPATINNLHHTPDTASLTQHKNIPQRVENPNTASTSQPPPIPVDFRIEPSLFVSIVKGSRIEHSLSLDFTHPLDQLQDQGYRIRSISVKKQNEQRDYAQKWNVGKEDIPLANEIHFRPTQEGIYTLAITIGNQKYPTGNQKYPTGNDITQLCTITVLDGSFKLKDVSIIPGGERAIDITLPQNKDPHLLWTIQRIYIEKEPDIDLAEQFNVSQYKGKSFGSDQVKAIYCKPNLETVPGTYVLTITWGLEGMPRTNTAATCKVKVHDKPSLQEKTKVVPICCKEQEEVSILVSDRITQHETQNNLVAWYIEQISICKETHTDSTATIVGPPKNSKHNIKAPFTIQAQAGSQGDYTLSITARCAYLGKTTDIRSYITCPVRVTCDVGFAIQIPTSSRTGKSAWDYKDYSPSKKQMRAYTITIACKKGQSLADYTITGIKVAALDKEKKKKIKITPDTPTHPNPSAIISFDPNLYIDKVIEDSTIQLYFDEVLYQAIEESKRCKAYQIEVTIEKGDQRETAVCELIP